LLYRREAATGRFTYHYGPHDPATIRQPASTKGMRTAKGYHNL
jgi:hypothetical protein